MIKFNYRGADMVVRTGEITCICDESGKAADLFFTYSCYCQAFIQSATLYRHSH